MNGPMSGWSTQAYPKEGWVDGWIGGFGMFEWKDKWMIYAYLKVQVMDRSVGLWVDSLYMLTPRKRLGGVVGVDE